MPFKHATYEVARDAWVVWDGDEATAEEIKRLYPYETVLLHDRETGEFSDYKIEVHIKKPVISAGRLTFPEGETIEV